MHDDSSACSSLKHMHTWIAPLLTGRPLSPKGDLPVIWVQLDMQSVSVLKGLSLPLSFGPVKSHLSGRRRQVWECSKTYTSKC